MNAHTTPPQMHFAPQYLTDVAQKLDIDHMFFVDAILRRTLGVMMESGIQPILTHSEKAAAYMADGYARIRKKPSIVMAQSVGAANLAAALQDSRMFGSSVIALTGRHLAVNQYKNAYQELPHDKMFEVFVKDSYRVDTPSQLAHVVPKAARLSATGPKGPVHIDILGNTGLDTDLNETRLPEADPRALAEVAPATANTGSLDAIVSLLNASARPLIVLGARAYMAGVGPAVAKLVEVTGCAVTVTLDAKSCFDNTDPAYLGIVGTYSCLSANKAACEADLILYIGCDMSDQVTNNHTVPAPDSDVKIVQLDDVDCDISLNRVADAYAIGALPDALFSLADQSTQPNRADWAARQQELNAEWNAIVESYVALQGDAISVARVLREMENWLPENAIVVADTGFSSQWSGTMLRLPHSGIDYIRAAGSLGWAYPASLGAKCAAPDRPVVCFTGDGAFFYHLCELETAARRGLKTITIVNNNGRLLQGQPNLIRSTEGITDRLDELAAFRPTNFAAIAETFGCMGIRVDRAEDIAPALKKADAASGSVVIDIATEATRLCPPAWEP